VLLGDGSISLSKSKRFLDLGKTFALALETFLHLPKIVGQPVQARFEVGALLIVGASIVVGPSFVGNRTRNNTC
jgi:hypothetical protein